jgi:hypothetical protein
MRVGLLHRAVRLGFRLLSCAMGSGFYVSCGRPAASFAAIKSAADMKQPLSPVAGSITPSVPQGTCGCKSRPGHQRLFALLISGGSFQLLI